MIAMSVLLAMASANKMAVFSCRGAGPTEFSLSYVQHGQKLRHVEIVVMGAPILERVQTRWKGVATPDGASFGFRKESGGGGFASGSMQLKRLDGSPGRYQLSWKSDVGGPRMVLEGAEQTAECVPADSAPAAGGQELG